MSYLGTIGFITGNLVSSSNVIQKVLEAQQGTSIGKNITNCITHIPNDIKLEAKGATLTLKASSVITIPDGFEEDGSTPKFIYKTIENDITKELTTDGKVRLLVFRLDTNELIVVESHLSSTSTPTTTSNYIHYNHSTNLMEGQLNSTKYRSSLPIARVNCTSKNYIDQVFNCVGYIGNTCFCQKGVTAIVPNGLNEDGSFNNYEFTTPRCLIGPLNSSTWGGTCALQLRSDFHNSDGSDNIRFTLNSISNITWDYDKNINGMVNSGTKEILYAACIPLENAIISKGKFLGMTQPLTYEQGILEACKRGWQ